MYSLQGMLSIGFMRAAHMHVGSGSQQEALRN